MDVTQDFIQSNMVIQQHEKDETRYREKKRRAERVVTVPTSKTCLERGYLSSNVRVQSISIPPTVTYLGEGALEYCSLLQSIIIPDSVTYIGAYAFNSCRSLKTASIPKSVFAIRANAFENCVSLESIIIPESVSYVEDYAFADCISLKSIVLPKELMFTGTSVFDNCVALDQRDKNGLNYHFSTEKWLQNRFSGLPIHRACYENVHEMSKEKFGKLIEEYKETLHIGDAMGMTPLHLLHCNPTAPMEMIHMLKHVTSPKAMNVVNVNGVSPLMLFYACKSINTNYYFDSIDSGPSLCDMLEQGVTCDNLQHLLNYDKDMVFLREMKDGDRKSGLYPFMSAASASKYYELDTVFQMMLMFPDVFQRFS